MTTVDETKELVAIEGEYNFMGEPIQRDLVVQFADTLMGIHPQAKEVGVIGMRTVAQLALLTGANPLPGTNGIHPWRDNKGNLNIQLGIGFLRGEAEKQGSVLWTIRPRPMTDEEREHYDIQSGIKAAICEGALRRDVFELMAESRAFGVEMGIKEAKGELGRVGIGIAGGSKDYAKNGRPIQWSADIRAERDLLRKLVPVLQRARDNAIGGEFKLSGMDWNAAEYVHLTDGETKAPPLDEMNSEWFGNAEPVEAVGDVATDDVVVSEPKPEPESPPDPRAENSPQEQAERGRPGQNKNGNVDWRAKIEAMENVTVGSICSMVAIAHEHYTNQWHAENATDHESGEWLDQTEALYLFDELMKRGDEKLAESA